MLVQTFYVKLLKKLMERLPGLFKSVKIPESKQDLDNNPSLSQILMINFFSKYKYKTQNNLLKPAYHYLHEF